MTTRLLVGDCRVTLPALEPGSVQAVVTSPPYYGLRDYGLPLLVWGGDEHVHDFEQVRRLQRSGVNHDGGAGYREREDRKYIVASGLCPCGAWLGSLGLEPTPDLYVEHLLEVFRHVRRVLRDDGVCFLNLGDSYAGSGNGQNDRRPSDASPSMRQIGPAERGQLGNRAVSGQRSGAGPVHGYKAKDLMMMPFRVAMALQADGWYLRSVIPWLKRNSMPESVTDRPATSLEYVFLLAKSARYFWDADAVRVAQLTPARGMDHLPPPNKGQTGAIGERAANLTRDGWIPNGRNTEGGRNRRNSDWFFESWQGLLLDEQDDPLALVVNPAPFTGAHFATFPAKLVEPMAKASTRPGDTVLDPFGGAGTVGLVADRLQRNAILCELKPEYADMGSNRITGDAPMFSEVEVA